MKTSFKRAVLKALEQDKRPAGEILTEADIQHLPQAVQKYIRISGCIGKEKVRNFRAEFTGKIRSTSADEFMSLRSVQYNFTGSPTRLFYIAAKKKGIPAKGVHLYIDRKAIMLIKILGLFKVVDAKGPEMDQGETVTLFNDMCFMAPATLADKNILWDETDDKTVHAQFTNGELKITATLYFNEKGELINFVSYDRFETLDGKTYLNRPWLTPVTGYTDIKGYHLPAGAKLIFKHPDEDLCYGEFYLSDIEYNCREYRFR
ncbi:MAG TPA: hypothetical protein PLJ84_01725 [Bacteroidales bacterium]|nr:hypothetical protein [Bacteroidales bacterium]HPT01287.1 hypothetical protein [Bacteroidales bacterium]